MVSLLTVIKFPASAAIFPFSPAALLRAKGPDAHTFLQGQFTNDLSKVSPGKSVYGLWLDRKGKVIADSTVVQGAGGQEFFIASIASPGPAIALHLGGHIIADDVEIADETGAWRGISLVGAGSGAWLTGGPRAGLAFPGRRDSGENWEWVFAEADAAAAGEAVAGARILNAADMERMRINSGIPSVPADIGPSDLPNEGGLDRDAISYSKGCYLGQEVMARIKSLGRVRRTLVRVRGTCAPPALPAGLWLGDRREGEVRSAVSDSGGFAGLALVSVAAAAGGGGGPLSLAPGAAGVVEIVSKP
jgi:folate-binding protein YgfZ